MSTPTPNNMRVIAVDPGYERLGIAVLEKTPKSKEVLLYSDCFVTSAKLPHSERLSLIGQEISRIIKEYKPERLGIETLFFNKNQKTAFYVAEARGVILYEAARHGLEINEFNPLQIKIAVTGYGRSEKEQVTFMVNKIVKIDKKIKHDDEYDAIACGITLLASHR